ncbi:hypothetical protein AQUCO_00100508v1 [Aquilegia coerulea]|uniref:Uncharacterized protein n=1 Tax=Aquilegia coerulea TaxID=218851 RepID=A0A2G5FAL4_AQUCA|nr:hypothetical protein AQUCO_00100508v1 [Aquilegia coerulea]
MNWGPNLQEERAACVCSCVAMDIGNWWESGRRSLRCGQRYNENEYDELATSNNLSVVGQSNKAGWRLLWRKLKKEQKRMFNSSAPVQVPYDAYTYSQNFDQGTAWAEPDNLPRSFSARYADPSRTLPRK